MNIGTSCARTLVAVALLLAATTLAGCGSDDDDGGTPLCSSISSLKSSVAGLTQIDINQDTLTNLQGSLDQVQSDLREVKDDASDEYAPEVEAVDKAMSDVSSSLDEAVAAPSLQSASAVAASVRVLGTSMKSLADAAKHTC